MTIVHGTLTAYRAGCPCVRCRYGQAAARRNSRPLGDPEAVRAHVRMLSAAGIGYRRAAELAGVSHHTVYRIVHKGVRPTASTVEKILAVQPTDPPAQRWAPAVGAVRRLQALRALGWSNEILAARVDMHRVALSRVTVERCSWIRRVNAASIRDLYTELAETPAPSSATASRNRTFARHRCWFPPIAWEPEALDDPEALPCLLPPVAPVDRDLELLVQHVVAGHPVEPTLDTRREIVRRMPGQKSRDVARVARCAVRDISYVRSQLEAS